MMTKMMLGLTMVAALAVPGFAQDQRAVEKVDRLIARHAGEDHQATSAETDRKLLEALQSRRVGIANDTGPAEAKRDAIEFLDRAIERVRSRIEQDSSR